jgi:hypothetical protein
MAALASPSPGDSAPSIVLGFPGNHEKKKEKKR